MSVLGDCPDKKQQNSHQWTAVLCVMGMELLEGNKDW